MKSKTHSYTKPESLKVLEFGLWLKITKGTMAEESLQEDLSSMFYREIEDLVSGIKSDKYWKVHKEKNDALYVVALTCARIPPKGGFQAKATFVKKVILSEKASKFSRHGRILVVKKRVFFSNTVIEWSIFLILFLIFCIEAQEPF